jgi:hypothetical protein
MKLQLKVSKADGSLEEYFHTKVMGAISNALGAAGQSDICIAEQLSEVVTYFLYHRQRGRVVTSSEIFSIIEAVLTATGYEDAAVALSEHHFERKLRRCRVEVVSMDIQDLADAKALCRAAEPGGTRRWDKSIIVRDLMAAGNVSRQTARTIASLVEERVFNMGTRLVLAGLLKQLVLGEAAAVLRAERQLETV